MQYQELKELCNELCIFEQPHHLKTFLSKCVEESMSTYVRSMRTVTSSQDYRNNVMQLKDVKYALQNSVYRAHITEEQRAIYYKSLEDVMVARAELRAKLSAYL